MLQVLRNEQSEHLDTACDIVERGGSLATMPLTMPARQEIVEPLSVLIAELRSGGKLSEFFKRQQAEQNQCPDEAESSETTPLAFSNMASTRTRTHARTPHARTHACAQASAFMIYGVLAVCSIVFTLCAKGRRRLTTTRNETELELGRVLSQHSRV